MQKRLHENSTTQTFMTTNNRQSIDFFSFDEKNSNKIKTNEIQKKMLIKKILTKTHKKNSKITRQYQ